MPNNRWNRVIRRLWGACKLKCCKQALLLSVSGILLLLCVLMSLALRISRPFFPLSRGTVTLMCERRRPDLYSLSNRCPCGVFFEKISSVQGRRKRVNIPWQVSGSSLLLLLQLLWTARRRADCGRLGVERCPLCIAATRTRIDTRNLFKERFLLEMSRQPRVHTRSSTHEEGREEAHIRPGWLACGSRCTLDGKPVVTHTDAH